MKFRSQDLADNQILILAALQTNKTVSSSGCPGLYSAYSDGRITKAWKKAAKRDEAVASECASIVASLHAGAAKSPDALSSIRKGLRKMVTEVAKMLDT